MAIEKIETPYGLTETDVNFYYVARTYLDTLPKQDVLFEDVAEILDDYVLGGKERKEITQEHGMKDRFMLRLVHEELQRLKNHPQLQHLNNKATPSQDNITQFPTRRPSKDKATDSSPALSRNDIDSDTKADPIFINDTQSPSDQFASVEGPNDEELLKIENDLSQSDFHWNIPPDDGLDLEDSMRSYLREIGRTPLLSTEEEIVMAKQIKEGGKAKKLLLSYSDTTQDMNIYLAGIKAQIDLEKNALLRMDKSNSLYIAAQAGKDAESRLRHASQQTFSIYLNGERQSKRFIEANLRLVVSIAKKYIGRGLSIIDLIQEGNDGLIRAAEKFDHTRGFKFSTMATWWIRQAITRAIADKGYEIRVPVHMVEKINKYHRTISNLEQLLGRLPTEAEIAEEMKITIDDLKKIAEADSQPVSLDKPVEEGEESTLGDFVENPTSDSPETIAENEELKDRIKSIMSGLTQREQDVIRLRFGLDDGKSHTLEEIGKEFKVTRERIRQIEAKALRKLRHPKNTRRIKDYLD